MFSSRRTIFQPAVTAGRGPCDWCRLHGYTGAYAGDCDDARGPLHGYDACNEAWEAHDFSCCRRCHQVGNCPYSADAHEYPHPEAVRDNLLEP